MYFISRNNKIYNFIAHLRFYQRYFLTITIIAIAGSLWFYLIHKPIEMYIALYNHEIKKYSSQRDEGMRSLHLNNELSSSIELLKTNIAPFITPENVDEYYKTKLLLVLEYVKQSGLELSSYASQNEKNKNWYKKNKAHLDLSGSLENCISFLKKIQTSSNMITCGAVSLARSSDNAYMLSCDIGFVLVKIH